MKMSGLITFVLGALAIAAMVSAVVGAVSSRRAERAAPPIGAFVEVDGERVHVLDIGKRDSALPPVVLIHGASVNLRDMKLALGDRLAAERRVIMVDRPGRGYSSRPADGWRLAKQAALINGAVKALKVERPIIVGQSFGGAVSLAYALQYQDELTGLVLLAPVSHEWPGTVAWYNRLSETPIAGFLLRRLVIPVYGPVAARSGVAKSFAPDDEPEGYYDIAGLPLLFRPRDFRSNASDLFHLKAEVIEQSARYSTLRLPVEIITGEDDRTVSPKLHTLALGRDIAGSNVELLPDTGHAIHHAEPARVIAAIERIGEATRPGIRQDALSDR